MSTYAIDAIVLLVIVIVVTWIVALLARPSESETFRAQGVVLLAMAGLCIVAVYGITIRSSVDMVLLWEDAMAGGVLARAFIGIIVALLYASFAFVVAGLFSILRR